MGRPQRELTANRLSGKRGAPHLAELHAARKGHRNLHDGTWGLRNLRTCLALRDSIRKRSSERVTPV